MPGPLQYGDGIKALVIDLLVAQMLSLRRCTELVQAITGIKLSEATCLGYIQRLYDSLEPWEAAAKEHLLTRPALNVDETDFMVNKKNQWLHVVTDGSLTLKYLHCKRGKDMHIETEDGKQFQFSSLLRKRCKGQWKGWLCGMDRTPENLLRFEVKKIKNELVIVATNIPAPKSALRLYRKRRGIEYLFADAKTKGFNIEDTQMIDPSKLTTLFIMVSHSMTWSYRCSSQEMGRGSIRKKKHGRFEKSWFRTGLDALRNWILHDPEEALSAWRRYCPKRSISNRCIIGILQCVVYYGRYQTPTAEFRIKPLT